MGLDRRLFIILLLCWGAPLFAQELKPFESGSYRAIVDTRGTNPFVLVFWSIDCPPCYSELKMLGEVQRSRPFDLVLVSTDGPGAAAEARRVLTRFGLGQTDAWLFAAPPERLRFEVDRTWYGELPRSYLFSGGRRAAVSGRLTAETFEAWLHGQDSVEASDVYIARRRST